MKHKTIDQAFKLAQRATRITGQEHTIIYYGSPVESWLAYKSGKLPQLIQKVNERSKKK